MIVRATPRSASASARRSGRESHNHVGAVGVVETCRVQLAQKGSGLYRLSDPWQVLHLRSSISLPQRYHPRRTHGNANPSSTRSNISASHHVSCISHDSTHVPSPATWPRPSATRRPGHLERRCQRRAGVSRPGAACRPNTARAGAPSLGRSVQMVDTSPAAPPAVTPGEALSDRFQVLTLSGSVVGGGDGVDERGA